MSFSPKWLSNKVLLDMVHRLIVTLSYFRPDRFVELLLYLLVSIDMEWNTDYFILELLQGLESRSET